MPYIIVKHQQRGLSMRTLTDGETALAQSVFGEMIEYDRVRIINYPYLPWQPNDIFIAPNGNIFVGDKYYRDDFSCHGRIYAQIFIHEMTHVMQYQQGLNVLLRGAGLQILHYLSAKKYNPYKYVFDPLKNFWAYNIEQQGVICEDIYLKRLPNIICQKP